MIKEINSPKEALNQVCPEAVKILKGCKTEFNKKIDDKNFVLKCGEWKEIEKLNNHQHMDWCTFCKSEIKGILTQMKNELKFLDNLSKYVPPSNLFLISNREETLKIAIKELEDTK